MANTTIALRQSGATGNTPSLGVLANGELSINYADGIIYYKTASNTLGSIRTTQPAGLTKEIQFNDAGSFGSDSDFTYDKTLNRLNVENVIVNTAITIGTGAGGIGPQHQQCSTKGYTMGFEVILGPKEYRRNGCPMTAFVLESATACKVC